MFFVESESGAEVEVAEGERIFVCFNRSSNLARISFISLTSISNTTSGKMDMSTIKF